MNNIIKNYLSKIQEIDTSIGVPKVVKTIDKLTQELYLELYKIKSGVGVRCPQPEIEKQGHCC
jgi:hypothetical protein